jgi:hypothetical protein
LAESQKAKEVATKQKTAAELAKEALVTLETEEKAAKKIYDDQ